MVMDVKEIREYLPHRYPFLLVDRVTTLNLGESIVAYKNVTINEPFFNGHFPDHPVMPGVLVIEAMAQAGVVAYGIYLYAAEHSPGEVDKLLTMFTDAQVDFAGMVKPGDRVTTTARKVFFRRKKLRCEMEMTLDDGTVVCSGVLSGMGVPR
jgi:3-hydroxyacyl-[acyl-carrier-protein] dehydratase